MLVICAGMYRSGSTWQYMVALHLLRSAGRRVENLQYADGDGLLARPLAMVDPAVDYVIKTHNAHPVFDYLVRAGGGVLYTYRDLRDVAYSLTHKLCRPFEAVVEVDRLLDAAAANDRFWAGLPGTLAQRYEEWVVDPVPAVRDIAARLGVPVGPEEAGRVAAEFSFARNVERAERTAAEFRASGLDLSDPRNALARDPDTQLHWNHLRDGRVGGWRDRATPAEVASLNQHVGAWLIERGYEPNHDWALKWSGRAA